jgi:hypothetical protein
VALSRRSVIELWPVALLAVLAPAVPIGFHVASLPAPREDYPIRLELPSARPLVPGEAAPAVDFDLSGSGGSGDGGGSAVELRKAVRLNGAEAGRATIRVSAASTLSISADELRAVLARAGRGDLARRIGAPGGAGRFVGFEEMRQQGIDVRYDAAADRIVIGA